jgi:hypothetical protein
MGIVTRSTRTLALWSEKPAGRPRSRSSFYAEPCQRWIPLHTRGDKGTHKTYRKHQPDISKLQHCIPAEGKVEVVQVEGLFIEKVQARKCET